MSERKDIKNKKRIIIKIGSSSLFHAETGKLDLVKMEKLAMLLSDLSNQGKEVILVTSGAQAAAKSSLNLHFDRSDIPLKQASAAIGQAQLMSIYQRAFAEFGKTVAQVLLTRYTIHSKLTRENAANTFDELIKLGVIPIVNENDTVTTEEIEFGDNDCLSALVSVLTGAELLIILSDVDGLYDSDPRSNPDAKLVSDVYDVDENTVKMGGNTPGSKFGTGGMSSKIDAAIIARDAGIDMMIISGNDLSNLTKALNGEEIGTFFHAGDTKKFIFREFDIKD